MPVVSSVTPSADVENAAVVRRLLEPSFYPDRPHEVRLVQTHISQVFLTDRFVYKLKKPVRFDFLDFSTPEKREWACREELRLNRRMSHDVYLSVLPITQEASGDVRLGGGGRVIDWVVQMRRLPVERMLDELIRTRRLSDFDGRRLADFLARYYVAAPPLIVRPDAFYDSLIAHTKANLQTLLTIGNIDQAQVRRVHTAQLRLLKCRAELFKARVVDGRIIDGHGDLRPEHICLTDPPAVFDCVEFSADLRCLDVLDELCFLAMECDLLEARSVGNEILDAYLAKSKDRPPPAMIPFYKSYRACVRAKVAALRSEQVAAAARQSQIELCKKYLTLADQYVLDIGARPLLIVVTGLMGTGKSTLARTLADELGIEVLRTDEVRHTVIPTDGRSDSFGEGRYRPEVNARIYDEILRRAADRLAAGTSVILDGTFTRAAYREAAVRLGRNLNAEVLVVECVCPRNTAIERIRERLNRAEPDASEARPEFYDLQAAERQREGDSRINLRIDATESLAAQATHILKALPC